MDNCFPPTLLFVQSMIITIYLGYSLKLGTRYLVSIVFIDNNLNNDCGLCVSGSLAMLHLVHPTKDIQNMLT